MPRPGVSRGSTVRVRAFEPGDEPRIVELLQAAFGQWPRDIRSVEPIEFFRWKHMGGPFGRSRLMVAEADSAVIAFHAYIPWRLSTRDRTLTTLRGGDLAVHPSYRRLGVATAMRAAARFPDEVAFTWSHPNKQNRPGAEKAGMVVVYRLPRFLRPCRALGRSAAQALAGGASATEDLQTDAALAGDLLPDGTRIASLLEQLDGSGDRMVTVKDLAYLCWRYGHLHEYRAIAADQGEGAGGLVIFRTRRHGPVWISDVCELFAARDDRRMARRLLDLVQRAAPADFISCAFSSRRHAARLGFLPARGSTVLMTLPLHRDLAPDPTRRDSWALSRGDLELL
jgi:GNAT superfamily N-acetyltransferase